jgi:uncharacterized membrane protein YjfL (UPF0719 family)
MESILMTAGLNLVYAVVSIAIAILAMFGAYKWFDKVTPFDTAEELKNGNLAVAIFNGAIVLGTGILSALVIGMSVN